MTKPVDTFEVQFKNPDFMWQSDKFRLSDEAMERLSEHSEYFTIELEMDEDMVIHSARFVPVKP